jgi:hypothetical protein
MDVIPPSGTLRKGERGLRMARGARPDASCPVRPPGHDLSLLSSQRLGWPGSWKAQRLDPFTETRLVVDSDPTQPGTIFGKASGTARALKFLALAMSVACPQVPRTRRYGTPTSSRTPRKTNPKMRPNRQKSRCGT